MGVDSNYFKSLCSWFYRSRTLFQVSPLKVYRAEKRALGLKMGKYFTEKLD